jgi:hypothetical protein
MNSSARTAPFTPSASEYILDNFEQIDRIVMLVLNRDLGETIQRITSAQKAASPRFQAWLRYKNANGSDIYIGMNPLKTDASTRTKEDIESTLTWITAAQKPSKRSRIPASSRSRTTS